MHLQQHINKKSHKMLIASKTKMFSYKVMYKEILELGMPKPNFVNLSILIFFR